VTGIRQFVSLAKLGFGPARSRANDAKSVVSAKAGRW